MKKLYDMACENEEEETKMSMYRLLFCGKFRKELEEMWKIVTAAGKAAYLKGEAVAIKP
jgi:hypothetical protein